MIMEMPSTLEFIKKMQMDFREATYDSAEEAQAQNIVSEVYCAEIIKALEKQIPKEPIINQEYEKTGAKEYICPVCKRTAWYSLRKHQKFCSECGQAFDWGEGE